MAAIREYTQEEIDFIKSNFRINGEKLEQYNRTKKYWCEAKLRKNCSCQYVFNGIVYGSSSTTIKHILEHGAAPMIAKKQGDFFGVSYQSRESKFLSQVSINKKRIYLSGCQLQQTAAALWDIAQIVLFDNTTQLNFGVKQARQMLADIDTDNDDYGAVKRSLEKIQDLYIQEHGEFIDPVEYEIIK